MTQPVLSLAVLRSPNLERLRRFYETLGISFVKERHGSGPEHYAGQIGPTILELYPGDAHSHAEIAGRWGFVVRCVDSTVVALAEVGADLVKKPADSPWGRRAVVRDPDGRLVEISHRGLGGDQSSLEGT